MSGYETWQKSTGRYPQNDVKFGHLRPQKIGLLPHPNYFCYFTLKAPRWPKDNGSFWFVPSWYLWSSCGEPRSAKWCLSLWLSLRPVAYMQAQYHLQTLLVSNTCCSSSSNIFMMISFQPCQSPHRGDQCAEQRAPLQNWWWQLWLPHVRALKGCTWGSEATWLELLFWLLS